MITTKISPNLGLDGCKVALHGGEATLQGHDTSKVIAQLICGLNELGLLVDPALLGKKK